MNIGIQEYRNIGIQENRKIAPKKNTISRIDRVSARLCKIEEKIILDGLEAANRKTG